MRPSQTPTCQVQRQYVGSKFRGSTSAANSQNFQTRETSEKQVCALRHQVYNVCEPRILTKTITPLARSTHTRWPLCWGRRRFKNSVVDFSLRSFESLFSNTAKSESDRKNKHFSRDDNLQRIIEPAKLLNSCVKFRLKYFTDLDGCITHVGWGLYLTQIISTPTFDSVGQFTL